MKSNKNTNPNNSSSYQQIPKSVLVWLVIGLVMIFVQVVVGGITRLTGSGLSITKWEIVTGTLPPLSTVQWEDAFDLYKATPQYKKINEGMSLSNFKWIYFWEYIHRLWARSMGFVFLFPFLYFLYKKYFPSWLIKRLGGTILLAVVVASFGWIMVASGLNNRPWVNAYKLTFHLSLAFILYSYLLWTTFKAFQPRLPVFNNLMLKRLGIAFTTILAMQIFLGGIVSGMKAALFFPTWPDMNGELVPSVLFQANEWNVDNFINYDKNSFMPSFVQFFHRSTAYLLIIIGLWYFRKAFKYPNSSSISNGSIMLITMLVIQVLLGIFTLVNSKGMIPVTLGVLHQAGALLLLTVALFMNYQFSNSNK